MIDRGEEKGKADFLDTGGRLRRGQLDIGTKRAEHIRRAAAAADRTVAMFGDFDPVTRDDKGGGRANIKGVSAITAGANNIQQHGIADVGGDLGRGTLHSTGTAGDLINRLPFHAQRGEERADLRFGRLAAHNLGHRPISLGTGQMLALKELMDRLLNRTLAHGSLLYKCGMK